MQKFTRRNVSAGLFCLALSAVAFADEEHEDDSELCGGHASPILTVADFDGNGVVDNDDIVLIKKARKQKIYYAFYDLNADGKINRRDVEHAVVDLGQTSTPADRKIAKLFHYNKQGQLLRSQQEIAAMDFIKIAEALAGHGEHWIHNYDMTHDFLHPQGLNVSAENEKAMGMFWSIDAIPVFENGATDFPMPGGDWMDSRVVAFANHPPSYTGRADETWHTHAGLCITAELDNGAPRMVLNQHTTFNECQALPSLIKAPGNINLWSNIWMLHAWMFDLNPNGFFANTHPCADPDAPAEETINGDRPVPPFFNHHG